MSQVQEQQQQVNISINDLIYAQVKDLGKRMDRLEKNLDVTRTELNARMDRLEHRQDKLEEKLETTRKELNARMDKQEEKIEKLADKIDALRNDLRGGLNHGQIATISAIGVGVASASIALGVIYALLK